MALTAKKALGAAKKFTKDTVVGLGALKGANLVVDSIVYNDTDMRTEVNVSWTGTDGSSQSGVAYLPYGVGIKSVRLDDNEENFIFTNTNDIDLDPVPIPKVQVKISKEDGNALVNKNDGLYVGETGIKISQEEGNDLVEKSDGLFVQGVSVSKEANNQLEEKADGLYVPETALSAESDNLLERKNDGLYVPSLKVNVSDLNDASKLLGIKLSDKVDKQVIIPCKTTVLSANVQQFDSAESVNLYKYNDGVSIYSKTLIDTNSDGVVVYDSNLRRFGNVKVNDDGLTFTLIGHESEFTFNISPSLVAETVKLHEAGFNIVLYEANEDYGVYININNIGIDTRLAVDLSNINETGINKIKEYAETANKVDIQQKVEDAGKALVVGSDGKLILDNISVDTKSIEDAIKSNWVGGYNLIPYPYKSSNLLPVQFPSTIDGVEYSLMPDGSVHAVGTPTGLNRLIIAKFKLPAGKYAISGSFDGEFSARVRLAIDGVFSNASSFKGSTGIFELANESNLEISLQFLTNDYAVDNYFKPMIVKVNEDESFPTIFQINSLGNVEITNRLSETPRNADIVKCWNENGYNLIKFPYLFQQGTVNRGITYNYLDDGSVIANGTVEGTLSSYAPISGLHDTITIEPGIYKISDGVNGTDETYWVTVYKKDESEICRSSRNNGFFEITEPTEVFFKVRVCQGYTVNNLVFKPMLVKVNEDGTYNAEYNRYALGNVKLTDELSNKVDIEQGAYIEQRIADNWGTGSYNIIRFPYYSNVLVSKGVTFTPNEDGSVHVEGTATDIVYYTFTSQIDSYLSLDLNKVYRLSCNIKSELELTSDAVAQFYYRDSEFSSSWRIINVNAEGDKYIDFSKTVESNDGGVLIRVLAGKTVNFTIKPMLYELNAQNNVVLPYQRYASSNVELTDKLGTTNSEIDTLKYDSISGGLNILDLSKRGSITNFRKNSEGYLTNKIADEGRDYFDLTIRVYNDSDSNNLRSIMLNQSTMSATIYFTVPSGYKYFIIKHNGAKTDLVIVNNTLSNLGIESNKPYTLNIKCSKVDPQSVEGIVITELAIFEGQEAHSYVPYIPSVNMLYNLVSGLRIKSIECSNGGHSVFYFQVGNLVIGSLISYGVLTSQWNQDINILEGGLLPRLSGMPASFKLNGGDTIDANSYIYIIPDGSLHVNKDIQPTTIYGYNAVFMYQTDEYI